MIVTTVAFEAMSANMIMPMVAKELDAVSSYGWAFSTFLAASVPGMVLAGQLTDRGRLRPTFISSLVLFTAGLTLGGLSWAFPVFVLGRALQGFGGGLYIVAVYVLIARLYPEGLRPRMFAVMPAAWAIAALLTPWLAATVASTWTWRANYLGTPPLILLATVAIALSIESSGDEKVHKDQRGRPSILRYTVAAAVGIGLLQFAGQNFSVGLLPVLLAGMALLIVGAPKLLPVGSLRFAQGVPAITTLRGVLGGAYVTAQSFVPLLLVEERGVSTSAAGAALSVSAMAWAVGAWYQGRKSVQHARRMLLRGGCALATVGIMTMSLLLVPDLPPMAIAVGAGVVGGVGMGIAVPSISVLLFEQSLPGEQGSNAAALQVSDSLGSAAALALTGLTFAQLESSTAVGFGAIVTLAGLLGVCATLLSRRCFTTRSAALLPAA
ncbi:MFS transporter [Streptomyces sp. NPDC088752]|uniref:MFS transporter n=1 Tax=Streptomyces sp. NPDC088752 TaxID=3154963 RepID=UPI00343E249B